MIGCGNPDHLCRSGSAIVVQLALFVLAERRSMAGRARRASARPVPAPDFHPHTVRLSPVVSYVPRPEGIEGQPVLTEDMVSVGACSVEVAN